MKKVWILGIVLVMGNLSKASVLDAFRGTVQDVKDTAWDTVRDVEDTGRQIWSSVTSFFRSDSDDKLVDETEDTAMLDIPLENEGPPGGDSNKENQQNAGVSGNASNDNSWVLSLEGSGSGESNDTETTTDQSLNDSTPFRVFRVSTPNPRTTQTATAAETTTNQRNTYNDNSWVLSLEVSRSGDPNYTTETYDPQTRDEYATQNPITGTANSSDAPSTGAEITTNQSTNGSVYPSDFPPTHTSTEAEITTNQGNAFGDEDLESSSEGSGDGEFNDTIKMDEPQTRDGNAAGRVTQNPISGTQTAEKGPTFALLTAAETTTNQLTATITTNQPTNGSVASKTSPSIQTSTTAEITTKQTTASTTVSSFNQTANGSVSPTTSPPAQTSTAAEITTDQSTNGSVSPTNFQSTQTSTEAEITTNGGKTIDDEDRESSSEGSESGESYHTIKSTGADTTRDQPTKGPVSSPNSPPTQTAAAELTNNQPTTGSVASQTSQPTPTPALLTAAEIITNQPTATVTTNQAANGSVSPPNSPPKQLPRAEDITTKQPTTTTTTTANQMANGSVSLLKTSPKQLPTAVEKTTNQPTNRSVSPPNFPPTPNPKPTSGEKISAYQPNATPNLELTEAEMTSKQPSDGAAVSQISNVYLAVLFIFLSFWLVV